MRDRKAITLPDAARSQAIASIKQYFAEELDDPIGDLKAMLVLDYILAEHGPVIYNQAIADARSYLDERVADLGAVLHRDEFPISSRTKRP